MQTESRATNILPALTAAAHMKIFTCRKQCCVFRMIIMVVYRRLFNAHTERPPTVPHLLITCTACSATRCMWKNERELCHIQLQIFLLPFCSSSRATLSCLDIAFKRTRLNTEH